MTFEIIATMLVGNIPAGILLFVWLKERAERIAAQDRHERLLLAVAGFRTEPDTQNIVRVDSAPPSGNYSTPALAAP